MVATQPRTSGPTGHYTIPVRFIDSSCRRLSRAGGTDRARVRTPVRARSSVGRAPALQAGGLGFKSRRVHGSNPTLDLERASAKQTNLQPIRPGRLWERLGGPDRHRARRQLEELAQPIMAVSLTDIAYAAWTKQKAEVNRNRVRLQLCCYKPDGGSLGSGADEGRAKPRYYHG